MNAITTIFHAMADTKLGKFSIRHAPQIAIGFGGVLGAGAIVTTVTATKRTLEQIDEEKERRVKEAHEEGDTDVTKDDIDLTKREIFNLAWRNAIVPVGLAGSSFLSFIAAYKFEHKKTLTLASLLTASDAKLIAMEKEMIDKLGEKKADEIKKEVSDKMAEERPEKKEEKALSEKDSLKVDTYESITTKTIWTKPSNLRMAIKEASNQFDRYEELDFNTWLMILENETGESIGRSCIGEDLRWIKKSPDDKFEDIVRIAWREREDHEPACDIEYREKPFKFR